MQGIGLLRTMRLVISAMVGVLLLSACVDGDGPNHFSLGGVVTGLANNSQLVLVNTVNNNSLTITANGPFIFNQGIAASGSYDISVSSQPAQQYCAVSNGVGRDVISNVTNIVINCSSNHKVIYSFTGNNSGLHPSTSLLQGSDGNFYGTTTNGGSSGHGTVFKVTPAGVETVLYSFTGGGDGANPSAELIVGSDGNFYGTTANGGSNGNGTVFKMTPGGVETVLYSFAGGSDGAGPYAGLIEGSDGNFYGTTTYGGGSSNSGTVFKMTLAGAETVLYSFAGGSDGANPFAGLIEGSDGNFYGTTGYGGSGNGTEFSGNGTVFKVTPAGVETVLYVFAGGSDGAGPFAGLIEGSDGSFYGTTAYGGSSNSGTVFKITSSGAETVLHSFAGGNDGVNPYAGLLVGSDGNFYGTTAYGGSSNSGTVFKIAPSGVETVLYPFAGGSDGATPFAGLIKGSDGNFYSTTSAGGGSNMGTVFAILN